MSMNQDRTTKRGQVRKKAVKRGAAGRAPGPRVSVIIPALNEARTIASVIRFARRDPVTAEVIVIDDGSVDGTPELAEAAGARVVTSSLLGKGASMEDGLQAARCDLLVYLDGDLRGLRRGLIGEMAAPLAADAADFVKGRFTRAAGRVTALTAQPLLRTYFPELADIAQPLGGIIAARRSLLGKLRFENDYGVDIGLLIDAAREQARIVEVDIGHLRHDSQPLERLAEMAAQVMRTILERAAEWGRLRVAFMKRQREKERQRNAHNPHTLRMLRGAERLALLDMDGTLLDGRFVLRLAEDTGRLDALGPYLDNADMEAGTRTRRIAAVFKGVRRAAFERVARATPLMPGAVELVVGLRKLGYLVGIVTDSYRLAAETVRRRVFADFTVSHVMKFRGDAASGSITLSPFMRHGKGCTEHRLCKLNVLRHLLEEAGLTPDRVLAVGDGDNDRCMLKAAGRSVAFRPKSEAVRRSAQDVVTGDLRELLALVSSTAQTQG